MNLEIFFKDDIPKDLKLDFKTMVTKIYQDETFRNKVATISNEKIDKIVFSIGGDGTFLSAIYKFGVNNIIYIPVNEGTLGFYTSWDFNSLSINNFKDVYINNLPLLNIQVDDQNYLCVNESTLINPTQTQILDIYINDNKFESFRGTGICVSTPSGSTAYNKSLQGSLFAPSNKLFQLTKIAPINNNKYRTISNSLILNNSDTLKIKFLEGTNYNSIITIDRESIQIEGDEIFFSLSNKTLSVLSLNYEFWERIKNNFLLNN